MPPVDDITAKTIARVQRSVDPWFLSQVSMNLYRGCAHGCAYCDGRAEKYHVAGDFQRDIQVKSNAISVLSSELGRLRQPGFVMIGGGVTDTWQPIEAQRRLARGALRLCLERGLPVHVLTKARLIERDLDLLAAIAERSSAILSFSIQTTDDLVRERFEPGAAPIPQRWALLERARALGIYTGVAAMPVLPGISDQPRAIDALIRRAADAGVDFVLCGGLTLRPGTQSDHYLATLRAHDPSLEAGYERVYSQAGASGVGDPRYHRRVQARFAESRARHGLPARAPRHIFTGQMPQYAELGVLLEHEQANGRERWGRAGHALQTWARATMGRHGSPIDVERTLRRRIDDGSIVEIAALPAGVLPTLRRLAADLPRPKPAPQMGLFGR